MSLPTDETQEITAALPTNVQANNGAEAEAGNHVVAAVKRVRLSAREAPFRSTGVAMIRITHAGQEIDYPVPIRSVPVIRDRELRKRTIEAPVPPDAGKTLDQQTMQYVQVYDEKNPEYLREVVAQTNLFVRLYVLEGLDCEIEDRDGRLVWDPAEGGVRDEAAALEALEASGWTSEHLEVLREDIAALTMTRQQREERERRKKS